MAVLIDQKLVWFSRYAKISGLLLSMLASYLSDCRALAK